MGKKELDWTSKKLKKNLSIKAKLMGLLAGSVILSCVVVLLASIRIFNKNLVEQERERIEYNTTGVMHIIDDWKLQLHQYGYLFSINTEFAEALSKKDNTLDEVLEEITSNLDLDFYAVTDASGKILSGVNLTGDVSKNDFVKKALQGEANWFYDSIGNQNYAIVSVYPVNYEDEIVGALILGYALDNGLLAIEVTEGYNLEVTIFKDNLRIDTTLLDENGNKMVGTKLDNAEIINTVFKKGENYVGNVKISGIYYSADYAPVISSDGKITGMLFVAKSLDKIDATRMKTITIVIPISIILAIILVFTVGMFVRWLMWRIKNVDNSLKEMATGEADLTKRCKLFVNDEIGSLVINFNAFCNKLQQIVSEVKDTKDELTQTGTDLSSSIEDTSNSITGIRETIVTIDDHIHKSGNSVAQTANAVEEVTGNIKILNDMMQTQTKEVSQAATAVEQMIGNITSVNNSVEKMASSFQSLSVNAQTGFSKQQDVNERIKQIETQSAMLQEANQAIASIASQTNLLAMNAAIEAAHAGEAGKGFSVVADEIRKLSETSSNQSRTIGDQLNKIKNSISEVVAASSESSEAFTAVSNQIMETDELVIQIKAAMDEQTEGSKQISQSLKLMNDSTFEVNNAYQNMSQKNEIIQHEVENLQGITSKMQQGMNDMTNASVRINETDSTLNHIAETVQSSIEKIGLQIDLFKV